MKLSVIIVSYNVKYFLSACLHSVISAAKDIECEVIVVDNNSSDDSVKMLRQNFPEVRIIANDFNAGFSKANNQAMGLATGRYVLLLNPDTIVEEDCFSKCLTYMENHPEAGGMGVKMVDGSGRFLPESKRGLPTPAVAFFKIFGLSYFFPTSRLFGKYHMGFLGEDEISEVEVLSGAFMLLRKSVVKKTGGLDETFFMYGEDIDMSKRINMAGFSNVYFPESRIIHFKGESTKKSSVNYVLVFYRAMIIFARKHFSEKNARLLSFLINSAIYFRALIALCRRLFDRIYMPLIDFVLLWLMMLGIKEGYEKFVLEDSAYYPGKVEILAFPIIVLCWIAGQFLSGGYHQPVKFKSVFKGLIAGTVLLLVLYAMLDESLRFSRAIVAISVIASFLLIPLSRLALSATGLFRLIRFSTINTAVIGSPGEIGLVKRIIGGSPERTKNLVFVSPVPKDSYAELPVEFTYSCKLNQISQAVKVFDLDEIIFCLGDVGVREVISLMQSPHVRRCNLYLHPFGSEYLLRSSSMQTSGEYIQADEIPVMKPWQAGRKRIFEIVFCSLALLVSPLMALAYRKPLVFISNMFGVLSGRYNLIGFPGEEKPKPFILSATSENINEHEFNKQRIEYIVNYGTEMDVEISMTGLSLLDGKARPE